MTKRKGIILAGGSGTRLYPLTLAVSKQLLPIYDKPMIYYPLTVLMLADIRDILIITTPQDQEQYIRLLGDGSQWGIHLEYKVQPSPDGLAQALIIGEEFLAGAPSALILGDNIFFGQGLSKLIGEASKDYENSTVFGYHVANPEQYGVAGFNADGTICSIVEKPKEPASNYAITGLYFFDEFATSHAKKIQPSKRGELEITSLLEIYLLEGLLKVKKMGRGYAWLDTGTHGSLLDASNFVRTMTNRQGTQVGSPDEVAFELGLIDKSQMELQSNKYKKNQYGEYLKSLLA